jgi:hypothetical protein
MRDSTLTRMYHPSRCLDLKTNLKLEDVWKAKKLGWGREGKKEIISVL